MFDPIVKNSAYQLRLCLLSTSASGYKANPTIAAGDFKVDKDGAGFANLATLPSVSPAGGVAVLVDFSAAEMNADTITLACIDQTNPKEWTDLVIVIQTTTANLTVPDIQSGLATSTEIAALPTDAENAAAVLAAAVLNPINANIKEVNDVTIQGTGAVGTDEWRKV